MAGCPAVASNLVATVGDDVGDRLLVDEGLEPPELEEPVADRPGWDLFLRLGQHDLAGGDAVPGVALELFVYDLRGRAAWSS